MTAKKHSRLTAIRARLKRIGSELNDANRRMFDIRTGERFTDRGGKAGRDRRARRPGASAR